MDTMQTDAPYRLYFAYGSNMDVEQMKARCPESELVALSRLDGYRFLLNSRGVATIVPVEGRAVHGVVWSISREDEDSLDRYEGVASGFYRKEKMTVFLADGDRAESLVYIAADSAPGRSRNGYLARIIKSAELHGLPLGYVEELKGWE